MFEDAIDTGSIRSLTNRKAAPLKSPLPSEIEVDDDVSEASESSVNTGKQDAEKQDVEKPNGEKPNGHTVDEPIEKHVEKDVDSDVDSDVETDTKKDIKKDDESDVEKEDEVDLAKSVEDLNGTAATNSARTSKRLSQVTLDNVSLGDGPPSEQPKGWLCQRTTCAWKE